MKARILVLGCVLLLALAGCDKFKLGGSSDSSATNSTSPTTTTTTTTSNDPNAPQSTDAKPAGTQGDSVESGNDRESEDSASHDRRADARKSLGL